MLVLGRKIGEQVKIGDDITIEVTKIKGQRITLAIAAPSGVRIVRGELESIDPPNPEPEEVPTG